jgi:hypothetical protein
VQRLAGSGARVRIATQMDYPYRWDSMVAGDGHVRA